MLNKYLQSRQTKLICKSSTAFNMHYIVSGTYTTSTPFYLVRLLAGLCVCVAERDELSSSKSSRFALECKSIQGVAKSAGARKSVNVIKRSNKPSRTEQVVHGRGRFASVYSLFAAAAAAQNYAFLYFILLKMEAALSIFSSAQAMTSVFTHSLLRSPSTSITEHVPLQPALMGSSPCPLSMEISFREMSLAILPCQYSHTIMDVPINLTTLVLMAFLCLFDKRHHA